MSFFDSLHTLQHSSRQKRVTVLIITVTIMMTCIIGLWILQFQISRGERGDSKSFITPFRILWGSFKENIRR